MELEMDNYRSKEQRSVADTIGRLNILMSEIEGKKSQPYFGASLGILGGLLAAKPIIRRIDRLNPRATFGNALLSIAAIGGTSMLIGGSIGLGTSLLANAIGTHLGRKAKPRTKEQQAKYENGGYEYNYYVPGLGAYNLARRKNKNL